MKKTRIFALLLALFLALSCMTLPALAAAENALEDTAASTEDPAAIDETAQEAPEDTTAQEAIVSADPNFTVAAKAALLIDLNTGRTVYEQDADERVYPASLTKIMTCLIPLENGDLSDVITIDEAALAGLDQDSSVVGLQVGEQITLENLLYCMMVHSGNDAANAVAEYIAGSTADFVRMMNERAYALGCKDTHFNNPNGLHDESHYTTARDLARITQAALKSENFRQIVDTAEYVIPESATGQEHKLKTTNLLIYESTGNSLYYPRATGVKTGYTSAAGRCLVATAEDDGIRFLSVLCGAKTTILESGDLLMESFPETIKLLDYGFDNYSYVTALSPLYPIAQVSVLNSAACSEANQAYMQKLMGIQMISYDKVNELRHVLYLKDKQTTLALMKKHAAVLAPKFHCVLEMLDREIAPLGIATWQRPKGGYFVSVNTEPGLAKRTLALCKEAGVVMTGAGATFPYGVDPQDSNIRIAPSLPPVAELQKAMEVFCVSLKLAALEKLLA